MRDSHRGELQVGRLGEPVIDGSRPVLSGDVYRTDGFHRVGIHRGETVQAHYPNASEGHKDKDGSVLLLSVAEEDGFFIRNIT